MESTGAKTTNQAQNVEDVYPLTPLQEGLLFHALAQSELYNQQVRCHFQGLLNVQVFQQAWDQVIKRHAILRTGFWWEGVERPVQIVRRQVHVPWYVLDWRHISASDQKVQLELLEQQGRQKGFDLKKAPLLHFHLIQITEDEYIFLWSHHHLLLDGWSMPLLMEEVVRYYDHIKKDMPYQPGRPRPYRDYIAWLKKQDVASAERFWKTYLNGFTTATQLPITNSVRSLEHQNFQRHLITLPRQATACLLAQTRKWHITVNTLLQGVWALLLNRYSGQTDVIFGATISGRPPELEGVDKMIGLFINTLPVRIQIDPKMKVRDWLQQIQAQQARCQQHGYTSLMDIHSWSEVPRGEQLFESLFVFENYPTDPSSLETFQDFRVLDIQFVEKTNYPLATQGSLQENQLHLQVVYNATYVEPALMEYVCEHLQMLLETLPLHDDHHLQDLPLLTESERQTLLTSWNDTQIDYPHEQTVPQIFAEQVAQRPDAIALVYGDIQLSYEYLDRRANQIAQMLSERGIEPEVCVGLYLERSEHTIIAMVGVLKAGGTYVPLDPQVPVQRLTWQIRDTQTRFLLTLSSLQTRLPRTYLPTFCLDQLPDPGANTSYGNIPLTSGHAQQLAYIMYTSGSTGTPKGVGIPHRGIVSLVKENGSISFNAQQIYSHTANLSFDASTLEIWAPLLNGARLVVVEQQTPTLDELARAIQQYAINSFVVPTALFHQMAQYKIEALEKIDQIMVGGDVVNVELVHKLLSKKSGQKVFNCYGPTENTSFTTSYAMTHEKQVGELVPIGKPCNNTTVYLLDESMQPVPIGTIGEIYMGGDGLARGYIQLADMTAERFVPNPFGKQAGERLYRTGDLARYRSDGTLEFLGRSDQQVKIRGFRVEPAEIEAILSQHLKLRECAILVKKTKNDDMQLIAYIVAKDLSAPPTDEELRQYTRESLPDYMVPSYFVWLETLPLTPNGKLDRQHLLQQLDTGEHQKHLLQSQQNKFDILSPPWDEIEFRLLKIWEDILHVQPLAVSSNFFELGGHSLMAVRMISQIKQEFGQEHSLDMLFKYPTIAQLATVLRRRIPTPENTDVLVPLQTKGSKQPLFCVHPAGGTAFCYANLSRLLGSEQPFYSLRLPSWAEAENYPGVEQQAETYIEAVRAIQSHGPYLLGGWSFGGIVAFEMAQQLRRQGETVALLAIIDSAVPQITSASVPEPDTSDAGLIRRAMKMLESLNRPVIKSDIAHLGIEQQLDYLCSRMKEVHMIPQDADISLTRRFLSVAELSRHAAYAYKPKMYEQTITVFRAEESIKHLRSIHTLDGQPTSNVSGGDDEIAGGWQNFTPSKVDVHVLPGDHEGIVVGTGVQALATALSQCIDKTY